MQIKLQDFYLWAGVSSFSELPTGLLRQDSKTDKTTHGGWGGNVGALSPAFSHQPPLSLCRDIKATQPINYSPEHLPAPTRSLCTLA